MATAQVKVQYVNPPKMGKKNGSIKTPDNQIYGVPPNLLPQFQAGGTYQIEYNSREFNGQWYKTVAGVTPVAAPVPSSNAGGGSAAPKWDDATPERIFVCGAINAAIEGGVIGFDQATIENAVRTLRNVWANTFGNKAVEQAKGELNDEIPF